MFAGWPRLLPPYTVLCMPCAGEELCKVKFQNTLQLRSVVQQVALTIAVAEAELEFEHRALTPKHVLIKAARGRVARFCVMKNRVYVDLHGYKATVIDFGASRLCAGIVFFISIYYNVILGYSLTYLYYSFWKVLPWTECNPEWATKYCFVQGTKFVWQRAAEQVFFSLGVAQGMIITMGSYNEFGNDLYSFVGGIVVFSVLGNMAYELHLDVPDVVSSGFGLAFITYPQAVSALSFPNLWAAAFFTMLFFLALGSQIAFAESLLSPLKDRIDYLHEHRTMLAAAACLIGFVLGIPLTTQVICISSIITSKPLTLGDYVYPTWVQIIGELLVFVPILAMAGGGFLHFFKCKGSCSEATKPRPEWGPKDPQTLTRYRLFLFERGVVPPGMTEADHESIKKNAMAAGDVAVGPEGPKPEVGGAPAVPPAPPPGGAAAPAGNVDNAKPAAALKP
ncbi:hypothetical protein V5799_007252 [Amblyomma americanum]|uniref:Sodium-dependent nutrient amino acid transporter 1 n=1 Tax=Amblyomma americanum TaxID=6943 RepID=A0AAQ4DU24_AMBAM